jgi:hypothetical protein
MQHMRELRRRSLSVRYRTQYPRSRSFLSAPGDPKAKQVSAHCCTVGLARDLSAYLPWASGAVPARVSFPHCEYTPVTKLFVGNLPFTATEASVRTLFAAHGTVETVALITDRDTGRPRGFGFVEVSSADASRAIDALNGKDFEGRALKVNEAQERERSGGARR